MEKCKWTCLSRYIKSSLFQAFRLWQRRKEMWAGKTARGGVGSEGEVSSSLYFSYFTPHSTIWKRGTGYIKGDHDFRDVVIASPWRIIVLASSLAFSPRLQVVYPYFRLRFWVICQNRHKEAVHLKIFYALITATLWTAVLRKMTKNEHALFPLGLERIIW